MRRSTTRLMKGAPVNQKTGKRQLTSPHRNDESGGTAEEPQTILEDYIEECFRGNKRLGGGPVPAIMPADMVKALEIVHDEGMDEAGDYLWRRMDDQLDALAKKAERQKRRRGAAKGL